MFDLQRYWASLGFMRQRGLIVCQCDREKAFDVLAKLSDSMAVYLLTDKPTISDLQRTSIVALSADTVRTQLLGAEYDLLVIDIAAGFSPDSVALMAGGLRGGGLCLLLFDTALSQWPSQACADYSRMLPYPLLPAESDYRFLQRVRAVVASLLADQVALLSEDISDLPRFLRQAVALNSLSIVANAEQTHAINALRNHTGLALITGMRGAGKSSLLGLLADALKADGRTVILLAASTAGKSAVLSAAQRPLVVVTLEQLLNPEKAKEWSFATPSEYSKHVLLIDESAALPVAVIESLVQRFATVIMATTTEGYEGSGQALAIKLLRRWRLRSDFLHIAMANSLRFHTPDPVSMFLQQALLLDTEPMDLPNADADAQLSWKYIPQALLLADDALLRQVYGLLRAAHYRTTPDDLRVLLDGSNTHCAVVINSQLQVVAVCLFVIEGNLDTEISAEIAAGRRRPRGHLLVQSLAQHVGQPQFLTQRVARVMRIAVAESMRRKGVASYCLQGVEEFLRHQGVGWQGSSFSASDEALGFWQSQGYQLLRMGQRRHPASGELSALVLKSLS